MTAQSVINFLNGQPGKRATFYYIWRMFTTSLVQHERDEEQKALSSALLQLVENNQIVKVFDKELGWFYCLPTNAR